MRPETRPRRWPHRQRQPEGKGAAAPQGWRRMEKTIGIQGHGWEPQHRRVCKEIGEKIEKKIIIKKKKIFSFN